MLQSLERTRPGEVRHGALARFRLAAASALCMCAGAAQAHHVMDYATPATAWQGLLSGLAHPVIGIDHLLFVVGAGVLAARLQRGFTLPLAFVIASTLAVVLGAGGAALPLGEVWVAVSLIVLGGVLLRARAPHGGAVAGLFLLGGAVHGVALSEGVVGAEMTPLYAYLAGLALVQCAIACGAWVAACRILRLRPALSLHRYAGVALGVAGGLLAMQAMLG